MPSLTMKSVLSLAVLAISPVVLATPVALPKIVLRQDFGTCRNQSCEVATVAGSTGSSVYNFPSYPIGDTQAGDCCIIRYFPAVKDEVYANRAGLQAYCAAHGGDAPLDKNPPGINSITVTTPKSKRQFNFGGSSSSSTTACKPNILIFAKGTLEPGDLGITIGPFLQSALNNINSSAWDIRGFNYDNSFDNDYCLGLPGGVTARGILHTAVTQCPNSRIAMSGYSQGALVVRNALARAPIADVKRVVNVVTFGDPFVGAPIGQYSGPLHVFCANGDGVCNGQLDVGLAHLSYGVDVTPAAQILQGTAA